MQATNNRIDLFPLISINCSPLSLSLSLPTFTQIKLTIDLSTGLMIEHSNDVGWLNLLGFSSRFHLVLDRDVAAERAENEPAFHKHECLEKGKLIGQGSSWTNHRRRCSALLPAQNGC